VSLPAQAQPGEVAPQALWQRVAATLERPLVPVPGPAAPLERLIEPAP
jgi:hypothetical protein